MKIVRKELKTVGNTRAEFEKELYNLSMLKMLRHPNLIEMLTAFTFKGRHNLLFPKADGKTLSHLLESSPQPRLNSLEQMIIALSGLCSALHAVHNFHYPDLDVLAIGCHHDLKPDNILVHKESFLLADFGLSTFKDSNKASDTSFKNVRGDYVAPECENLQDLSERRVIGRSSDIWSLGCIMSEVITYSMTGPKGVTDFEKERGFKIEDHKRYRFHRGLGVESPAVTLQLDRLQRCITSRAGAKLLLLTREMLSLDPKRRPTAAEIDKKMQYLSVEVLGEDIREQCLCIFQISRSMQAWLVLSKFTSWMRVCKIHQNEVLERWHTDQYPNYQLTIKYLHNMQETLTAIRPDCERHLSHIYRPLHDLNHNLHQALPTDLQNQAEAIFRSQALDNIDNNGLDGISKDKSILSDQAMISVLARVRLLNAFLDDESIVSYPELKIDPSHLRDNLGAEITPSKHKRQNFKDERKRFKGNHKLQTLREEGNEPILVLTESKIYIDDISEEFLAELANRVSKIAKFLQGVGPEFRTLPCSGYYHDSGQGSCGLVYRYPPSTVPHSELTFTTLKKGLGQDGSNLRIALEQRFQLAHDLAMSLLKFHEAGWLQKNVSSFNLGFFHRKDCSWQDAIGKPYFVGFLYSRPSDRLAFTEYVINPSEIAYQHPDYIEGNGKVKVRYRLQFDYYSLGLILLEIGFWESIESLSSGIGSRKVMLEELRKDKVPRLGKRMGSIYQDVTALCLGDEFRPMAGMENSTRGDVELRLRFSEQVVNQLASCRV